MKKHLGNAQLKDWHRIDLGASTFKTTSKGGPHWQHVKARVTFDINENRILEALPVEKVARSLEHGRLPFGHCDLATYLIYDDRRRSLVLDGITNTTQ